MLAVAVAEMVKVVEPPEEGMVEEAKEQEIPEGREVAIDRETSSGRLLPEGVTLTVTVRLVELPCVTEVEETLVLKL
ncbi:hypothetical protein DRO53_05015 [Candidatus Bathyarchaeota archaeon]|nr:MAG: hypothetical protein DRO46_02870 [Candidatus Hecatellales archaeon]RLI33697.1 MAG: hypothetical protein DRO53_05015 [Candidatus Bathyarchaeota archaeon]